MIKELWKDFKEFNFTAEIFMAIMFAIIANNTDTEVKEVMYILIAFMFIVSNTIHRKLDKIIKKQKEETNE